MISSKTPRAVLPRILAALIALATCWFLLGISGVGNQALADANDAIENTIEGENNSDDPLNEDLDTGEGDDEDLDTDGAGDGEDLDTIGEGDELYDDDDDDEYWDENDEWSDDDEYLDKVDGEWYDGDDDEGQDADGAGDGDDDEGLDADGAGDGDGDEYWDEDDEWSDDDEYWDEDDEWSDDEYWDEDDEWSDDEYWDEDDDENLDGDDAIADVYVTDCMYCYDTISGICYSDSECGYAIGEIEARYQPALSDGSYDSEPVASSFEIAPRYTLCDSMALGGDPAPEFAEAADNTPANDSVATDENAVVNATDTQATSQTVSVDEPALGNTPATSSDVEGDTQDGETQEKAPLDAAAKAAAAFATIGFLAFRRKR